MNIVDIPIKDLKNPPKLAFPNRCVNCGKPKVKSFPIKLITGVRKSGQMVQLEMDVPLCAECAAKEDKIANITVMPFFFVGLPTFVIVFIPVWILSPAGTTSQTYALPYVLGATAGLLVGVIVGTLVELVLKILFTPLYGKLLLKRQFTVFSMLSDSQNLIGLSARFADGKKRLSLLFENEEIARDFLALNPQENV